jgi:PncC family amidohydrolase
MNISYYQTPSLYDLTRQLAQLLSSSGKSCSVAESCTGGMIGATLTSVPGSSIWFFGGIIAYDNDVKMRILGVPETILAEKGAVSAETVEIMAKEAADLIETDCAIAVSGIAGPGGGTEDKPVGLVFIGIYFGGKSVSFRHQFEGDREEVRSTTVAAALQHMIDCLNQTA